MLRPIQVDANYVETLGLDVLAGRSFAASDPMERNRGFILNQAAVAAMGGDEDEAVGKSFRLVPDLDKARGIVIGVVENFHTSSLHSPIAPLVLALELEFSPSESMLATRLSPNGISAGMDHLRGVMAAVAPQVNFTYTFLDSKIAAAYEAEQQMRRLVGAGAGLAIFVALLGLIGLTGFTVRRRTKEISIRKVLGASVTSIVRLLSTDVAMLVSVGFLVGSPAAYFLAEWWLQDFARRIVLTPWPFVAVGGAALLCALMSVSVHTIRAARIDPATTLRDE